MAIKFESFRGTGGAVTGGLTYKGSYDAATNNPVLTSAKKGDFYIVSVAGTLAGVTLNVGDHIVFNQDASSPITSAMFDVIDNTDAVASVNGQTGVVVLDTDDVSEGATNQYYTNARADARIAAADANDLNDVSYTAGAGIDGYVLTYNNTSGNWEAQVAASAPVTSVNTQTGAVVLDTDDVAEGLSNQYFTNARADARIAAATANDLSDVSYTAGAGIDGYVMKYNNTSGNWEAQAETSGAVTSVNTQTGAVVLDTDDVAEGASNLYYTNARADARIAAATANDLSDVSYTAGAGIDGYVMTYNNTSGNWEAQVVASAPVTSVNTQTGAVVLDTDDVAEGASNLYYTNARFDTQLATKTTDNLTEGVSNLYYTNARFDTQLGTKTTDNLTEGSTNLYFTNARADAQIAAATANDLSDVSYTAGAGIDGYVMTYNNTSGNWEAQVAASAPVTSVNTQTGAVVLDTDDVAEGASNLYYTNARADARIAAATANDLSDVSYTAGAGIDGYVMTYNNTSGNWEAQVAASAPVTSVNTQTGAVVLDTDDVAEGASNLYYTNARFDTQLGTKTTDNLTEGSTNLYFTNARADARIAAATANDLSDVSYTAGAGIDGYVMKYNNTSGNWEAQAETSGAVTSVNTQTGAVVLDTDDVAEGASNLYYTNARFDTQLGTKTTDNLTEGSTNLYYTNARADARIAAATANDLSDVSYTAGAGIDGYVMTYNNTSGNWEAQAASGGGGFTYTAITSASSPVSGAASTHYSADTSGGAITINLPALSGVTAGLELRVKLKTAGNNLILSPNGTDQVDLGGAGTNYTLTVQNQAVTLVSDGSSNWEVI